MSTIELLEIILLPLLLVVAISLPLYFAFSRKQDKHRVRRAVILNLCSFAAVLLCAFLLPIGGFTQAAETAETVTNAGSDISIGLGYIGASLAVGIGSLGCGIAVGNAAPAAIGAIVEDPKALAKSLIFVALGEGVAIYGLLIAIMILGKL